MDAAWVRWPVRLLWAWLLACEGAPPVVPIPVAGLEGSTAMAELDFGEDRRVRVRRLSGAARPGESIGVDLEVPGPRPLDLVLTVWPQRLGGRQVVVGNGVTAADQVRVQDARVQRLVLSGVSGDVAASLPVPASWHSPTAIVTLSVVAGETTVPAVAGPRTHDGLGVAGLVAVEVEPTSVTAPRAQTPPHIDGRLDEPIWSNPPTALVESLDGEPSLPTSQVWFGWDQNALYVAAHLEDEDVWSEYTADDEPLWKQEAFEVFLFGATEGQGYLELQVSPRGHRFDAAFTGHRRGDETWDGAWQAAVTVEGTVDRRGDRDRSWTVELAVPWPEICAHSQTPCVPAPGLVTRVNAFRLDRPKGRAPLAQALSPTREPDFHRRANAATLELLP